MTTDWQYLVVENNPNVAYREFMDHFVKQYDKHCPVKYVRSKKTIAADTWLTPGLRNACKKKNRLYKLFLKQRTQIAEKRYKLYKNKLTSIIRCSQKNHYEKLISSKQGDIKATWKILNSVIKRGQCNSE